MRKVGRIFLSVLLLFSVFVPRAGAADKRTLDLIPDEYKLPIKRALKVSGQNAAELTRAITSVQGEEREGMIFLISHMPDSDLKSLTAGYLLDNVRFAYRSWREFPWAREIPREIFLNYVLPYASVNERRDNWREDFYNRFYKKARQAPTIEQAATRLNVDWPAELKVQYDGVKRPKPDQSPYESMQAHYASCTGLSILAVDVFRSVGIPARLVGIYQWTDGGNHTWIEIWADGRWHHMGAGESDQLDMAWFNDKAAQFSDSSKRTHRIYAVSFKRTRIKFPMIWAPELHTVFAQDVTEYYRQKKYLRPKPTKKSRGECCMFVSPSLGRP